MEPRNFSYIFIPFRIREEDAPLLDVRCDKSDNWNREQDSLRYLLRYVANKIDGRDGAARCRHYLLTGGCDVIGNVCTAYRKAKHTITEGREGRFELTPQRIDLFTFSTGICLASVMVELGSADIEYQINARYHLKYAGRTKYSSPVRKGSFSMFDIVAECLSPVTEGMEPEYLFYTAHSNELSFVLTYLDADRTESTAEDMAYLRNCFARSYFISRDPKKDEEESYIITSEVSWGLTDQSVICLGHMDGGNPGFIEKVFPNNVKQQYLFMFVFLLHQKYALYNFMTQIDTELRSNLDQLEKYKERLGDFKTYFVFSRISETPQYQGLYEKVCRAFALEKMYEDVNEPLEMLGEIIRKRELKRRAEEEEREREKEAERANRENRLGLLLAMLSLLGIYSAFADAEQFAATIMKALSYIGVPGNLCGPIAVIIRVIFFLSIVVLAVYIIANMLKTREKKRKNKE